MSIVDDIAGAPSDEHLFEVVTITHEQLAQGITTGNVRPFHDLGAALGYARTLPADEQERSWIRTPEGTKTLAGAEAAIKSEAAQPSQAVSGSALP